MNKSIEIQNVGLVRNRQLTKRGVELIEHFEHAVIRRGIPENMATTAYVNMVHRFKHGLTPSRFVLENPHLHSLLFEAYCESTGQDISMFEMDMSNDKPQARKMKLQQIIGHIQDVLKTQLMDRDLKLTPEGKLVLDVIDSHKTSTNQSVAHYRKRTGEGLTSIDRQTYIKEYPSTHKELIMAYIQYSLLDEFTATEAKQLMQQVQDFT